MPPKPFTPLLIQKGSLASVATVRWCHHHGAAELWALEAECYNPISRHSCCSLFSRPWFSKTFFWGLEAECFNPISKHSSCRSREMDTPAALVLRNRLRNRGCSSSTELFGHLYKAVHFCIFDMFVLLPMCYFFTQGDNLINSTPLSAAFTRWTLKRHISRRNTRLSKSAQGSFWRV